MAFDVSKSSAPEDRPKGIFGMIKIWAYKVISAFCSAYSLINLLFYSQVLDPSKLSLIFLASGCIVLFVLQAVSSAYLFPQFEVIMGIGVEIDIFYIFLFVEPANFYILNVYLPLRNLGRKPKSGEHASFGCPSVVETLD